MQSNFVPNMTGKLWLTECWSDKKNRDPFQRKIQCLNDGSVSRLPTVVFICLSQIATHVFSRNKITQKTSVYLHTFVYSRAWGSLSMFARTRKLMFVLTTNGRQEYLSRKQQLQFAGTVQQNWQRTMHVTEKFILNITLTRLLLN